MRLPRSGARCPELLELDVLRRQLRLGSPVNEGRHEILIQQIVGTLGRAGDFDGCFRPLRPHLEKRLREIRDAQPTGLLEPIEVFRVDRAYFVSDGHKRVALAREQGGEFIDAQVANLPSAYELAPGVATDAIDLTARERRFREESGLAAAVPKARFPLSEPEAYAELRDALLAYGYEASQRVGRLLTRAEAAELWYRCVYLPTVRSGHESGVPKLVSFCTDADLFLALHQQSRALWGTECTRAEETLRTVLASEQDRGSDESLVDRVLRRARRRRVAPRLLAETEAAEEPLPS